MTELKSNEIELYGELPPEVKVSREFRTRKETSDFLQKKLDGPVWATGRVIEIGKEETESEK